MHTFMFANVTDTIKIKTCHTVLHLCIAAVYGSLYDMTNLAYTELEHNNTRVTNTQ